MSGVSDIAEIEPGVSRIHSIVTEICCCMCIRDGAFAYTQVCQFALSWFLLRSRDSSGHGSCTVVSGVPDITGIQPGVSMIQRTVIVIG